LLQLLQLVSFHLATSVGFGQNYPPAS
jgi:hypothetical protein